MADEKSRGGPGRRFHVEVQQDGPARRLVLVGELDLGTVGEVESRLSPVGDGVKRLVIDLRRLEFIDSTGIRLLLQLDALARQDGFDLAIVKGPPPVQHVFDVTRLNSRLPLVDAP